MGRDIKFRAWDNKEKKWLLGYEYTNLGGFSMFGETMLFEEWSRVLNRFILQQYDRKPEDLILMQFTGLKDKNGKEIYEGDVFRYEEWHGSIEHTMYEQSEAKGGRSVNWFKNGVVLWHPEAACYIHRKPNDIEDMTYYGNTFSASWTKEWEVIGNIYETPELLTP